MRAAQAFASSRPRVAAKQHVLGYRHVRHQAEMLVHHGDAARNASAGPGGAYGVPSNSIVAGVRLVDTEDEVAQGRLASAILAEQAMHCAGAISSEISLSAWTRPNRLETRRAPACSPRAHAGLPVRARARDFRDAIVSPPAP